MRWSSRGRSNAARAAWLAAGGLATAACSLVVSTDDLTGGPALGDAGSDVTADALVTVDSNVPRDDGAIDGAVDAARDASPPDAAASYRDVVMSDTPVAYWRLGATPGATTVADEVGKYPGTVHGGVTAGVAGALSGDTAMRFDGTSGVIDMGDVLGFTAHAPFSLEAWISPDVVDANFRDVVSKIVGHTNPDAGLLFDGYSFLLQSARGCHFVLCVSELDCASPRVVAPPTGTFTHVVATYDGAVATIYFDGAVKLAQPFGAALVATTAHFFIGGEVAGGFWQGVIDEVAVYDRALAPARVTAHFLARH